jgi:predicted O-methyltransferase YrrM
VRLAKDLLWACYDTLIPGPKTGRSGALRGTVLQLEARKSDRNLQKLLDFEQRSPARSAWAGLGTIAYEIVRHYRPTRIVELGSFAGFSTCAMGLAMKDAGIPGQIYAVDCWEGDGDTKRYGEEVYQWFLACRKELGLEHVIVPLRMTFEEAAKKVEPGIDLLHVDGWHKFRAVRHDFATFRPHLRKGGLAMFHDVNHGFRGMRLFWRMVAMRYPHYLIPYGCGLGVVQV